LKVQNITPDLSGCEQNVKLMLIPRKNFSFTGSAGIPAGNGAEGGVKAVNNKLTQM